MLPEQTHIEMISLTPAAAEAVRGLLEKRNLDPKDYALRVFIAGGGCSGFQYGMALEANIRPSDLVAEFDGIRVVVDEVSIDYLRGASVDYIESVMGSGFKIENPNAISTCGCGSSFRTKEGGASSGGGCSGCG